MSSTTKNTEITHLNGVADAHSDAHERVQLVRDSVTKLRPYIPGKPIAEVKRELGLADDFPIVKLASNENVLGPSPHAVDAMSRVLADVWLYPDDLCFDLKNRLAQFWNLSPEHFIIGNGSDEIIHFLALAFLDPQRGDETIFAEPSFVQYKAAAMMADCPFVAVPLTHDMRHDLRAMKAAVTPKTKLIFIANPNNPTGTCITKEELDALLDGLPKHVLVVLDQAYLEYVESEYSPRGLDYIEHHNVIVLQTFSKAYALAGLRVGYGVARPELVKMLQQVRGPFNVNMVAQGAAIASLADDEQIENAQRVNSEGKAQLYAAFRELNMEYVPTEANFVLVDCGRDAKTVEAELMKRGVIVRSGFGLPQHLRVTIGTREMNERFISSLREIAASA
jgi:histidinol-phosphate aminotransferase